MILTELKHYLAATKHANLDELAIHFHTDACVIRDMLDFLLRKGLIKKTTKTPHCGVKCQLCKPRTTEIYQWIET